MINIAEEAVRLLEAGEGFALATIITHEGSTPCNPGAKMLVRKDRSIVGTIGGGLLERDAQDAALEVIKNKIPYLMYYCLNAAEAGKQGMACGGETEVFIDYADPEEKTYLALFKELYKILSKGKSAWFGFYSPKKAGTDKTMQKCRLCLLPHSGEHIGDLQIDAEPLKRMRKFSGYSEFDLPNGRRLFIQCVGTEGNIIVFGAGHVSQKLVPMLSMLGFETIVMDDRKEFASVERFPTASKVMVIPTFDRDIFAKVKCGESTYCIIVTRGHAHDMEVLDQCLSKNPRYIGMIGSLPKRNAVYEALKAKGRTEEELSKVYSPIGVSIGAQTLEEIAISITAEIIRVHRTGK